LRNLCLKEQKEFVIPAKRQRRAGIGEPQVFVIYSKYKSPVRGSPIPDLRFAASGMTKPEFFKDLLGVRAVMRFDLKENPGRFRPGPRKPQCPGFPSNSYCVLQNSQVTTILPSTVM